MFLLHALLHISPIRWQNSSFQKNIKSSCPWIYCLVLFRSYVSGDFITFSTDLGETGPYAVEKMYVLRLLSHYSGQIAFLVANVSANQQPPNGHVQTGTVSSLREQWRPVPRRFMQRSDRDTGCFVDNNLHKLSVTWCAQSALQLSQWCYSQTQPRGAGSQIWQEKGGCVVTYLVFTVSCKPRQR